MISGNCFVLATSNCEHSMLQGYNLSSGNCLTLPHNNASSQHSPEPSTSLKLLEHAVAKITLLSVIINKWNLSIQLWLALFSRHLHLNQLYNLAIYHQGDDHLCTNVNLYCN